MHLVSVSPTLFDLFTLVTLITICHSKTNLQGELSLSPPMTPISRYCTSQTVTALRWSLQGCVGDCNLVA